MMHDVKVKEEFF